jgi:rare lipoprotein A
LGYGTDIDFEVRVKTRALPALLLLIATCSTGCATVARKPAVAAPAPQQRTSRGLASYYGIGFDGKDTASGIPFDMDAMVAAHPTLPFGTVVRVTNLKNGRSADVRIVDRGPARGPRAEGVIIDVSRGVAQALDFIRDGRVPVTLVVLQSTED